MVWVVSQSLTWVVIVAGGPGQEEYQTGQEEYRTVSRAWPGIILNGAPMNALARNNILVCRAGPSLPPQARPSQPLSSSLPIPHSLVAAVTAAGG